jgi:hypothetical protein
VPAHGMRETQTVTAENDGKEVVITDEYWYSQDLRINLMKAGFLMYALAEDAARLRPAMQDPEIMQEILSL